VALKYLRVPEGETLAQFKDEFRLLRDVAHDNLVTLEELRTEGPHVFFTMELVDDGQTFLSYVRSPQANTGFRDANGRCLDLARLRSTLPQLVGALTTLHRHGIVHRDIKPSNVLVTPQGRVVVLDFGIVWALERDGLSRHDGTEPPWALPVLGTGAYIAPERMSASGSTAAADWYSVGVIFYEALTGRLPFEGSGHEQFRAKQTHRPRPPHEIVPGVDREWSEVCMGLLERDPLVRLNGSALARLFGPVPEAPVETYTAEDDLLGRDSHLDALADAFAATREGQTVVALVSGRSGMGKTALVRQFLADQRECEPALLTLRSRCYERESMPYKAIDPIVDALSRYLRQLPDDEVKDLVPHDAAILTRVFPALLEVRAMALARDPNASTLDSATLRQRAATALRDLLARIAIAVPLIISIDDAQWGDADSAAILPFVLHPPAAPRVLLIAAYRSEDAGSSPLVKALHRLVRDNDAPLHCQLSVDPLSPEDACLLASRLAGAKGHDAVLAAGIARESGGSPFFVHELARHAGTTGDATTLDDVVRDRILSLPESTQHLMAVVALSSQPIPPVVAEAAASISSNERSVLHVLTAGRLVRSPGGSDEITFEPYHDRIREAVVGQLSPGDLAAWHRRLAEAWEQSRFARPETLATHYAGAGDAMRASVYAEQAATLAEHALAFGRAAESYRLLLRLNAHPERRRQWLIGLGDALVNDGRGYDASHTFVEALKLVDSDAAIELESRAAAELIRAGYLGEASAALGRLLPKVGIRPPTSDAQAILTFVAYRLLIWLRGIAVRERPESDVAPELLRRIDVLIAIGAPLSLIALPRGLSLNMQATWYALRAGERKRASLGLALLAATSSMRGTRARRACRRFIAAANALVPAGDAYTMARTLLAEGICLKVTGRWKRGIECLESAIDLFLTCPGSRWEIETAQTLRHDALIWTGEWKRLASELPARRHEAEQRGDRYSAAHVAGRLSPLMSLVADRAAQAHEEAEAAARHSSEPHYNLQARASLCAWLDVDLYVGEPERAAKRLEQAWPALKGTLSLFQSGRIEILTYRARIALALAARGDRHALKQAADAATKLEGEGAEWASAFAVLIRAGIAQGRGRTAEALDLLTKAQRRLSAADMRLYAAAAAYRRGQLTDGDQGRAIESGAVDVLLGENVVAPLHMVGLLCPGPWESRATVPLRRDSRP
jgi:serine/threonine protein kinase